MLEHEAYYILLRTSSPVLSKKEYNDWREIQDEYEDYQASFPPLTIDELIKYFEEDFKEESNWPFSKKEIADFYNGNDLVFYSTRE